MTASGVPGASARFFASASACRSNQKGNSTVVDRYLVVFGHDAHGNPRASRFAEHEAGLAIKAAQSFGYRTLQLTDAGLAQRLVPGNVFARGEAFIRRVSRARFEQLAAVAKNAARRTDSAGR
jgi:hypothetical protein